MRSYFTSGTFRKSFLLEKNEGLATRMETMEMDRKKKG
jgi:hypothetical protein